MDGLTPDDIVAILNELQYGHLQRRFCSAEAPMALEDKDRYRWSHPDAKELGAFQNLVKVECPHCGLIFTCLPRPVSGPVH